MGWWPEERWERMRRGVDCPMCADGHLPSNVHGNLLTELPGSYARLVRNQTHPGYCVVIAKRHVPELHDLSPVELSDFWTDVATVGRAVKEVFHPAKLDNLVMGHLCPHVHCHVYPMGQTDDPHALIDIQQGDTVLEGPEWDERVAIMTVAVLRASDDRRRMG